MSRSAYHLGFTTLASETRVDALPLRGVVPDWLKGSLVRTGPGRFEVGERTSGDFLDSLVKLDLERRATSSWYEEGCYPGEPIFVERPAATQEDDGAILSVVLDTRRGASFLLILDAATFQEVGRAEAPHHIPFGFHGSYLTGAPVS
jgi:carotenoid cleavage dioxygenase-like enzyme